MAKEGFKRKLTAILSADVVGYSRLMEDDEEATIRTLDTFRGSMIKLVKEHRGRVVDTSGDSLLAEFSSAVDAVNSAAEIQRELAELNSELPYERKMEFRIGVNVGDVIEDEDRIIGDGVNIAARVEGLAEAGGICITGRVYDQVENKLDLEYEFLGEKGVKNIARPIRVYRVLSHPGAAAHRVIKTRRAVGKRWRNVILILVAVIAVALIFVWNSYIRLPSVVLGSGKKITMDSPKGPSVAVLPFANMSGDPEEDYFSDGLTENIITGLSACPKLFVIARNSTFTYRGKSVKVQQVARELGVQYLVEGSVQRAGERVRINAQLIDANSGHHIWAEKYDKTLKDIFLLQDEITIELITAMSVNLTEGEQAQLRFKKTKNLKAYMKILKAYEYFQHGNRSDNVLARREAEEAIGLDSDNPNAYLLLAGTHMFDMWWGASSWPIYSFAQATKNINKVFELDKNNSDAHCILGMLYLFKRQHEKAIAAAERAVVINPNGADAHCFLAYILYMSGKHDKALLFYKKAFELNPIPPSWYYEMLGETYLIMEQYEEAISYFNKTLNIEPNSIFSHVGLVVAYTKIGKLEKASFEISEVYRIDPDFSIDDIDNPYIDPEAAKKNYSDILREAGVK
jgi:TolB-like protein/class 3 adenylate cyclase/Flp pilus assembly protein TadD